MTSSSSSITPPPKAPVSNERQEPMLCPQCHQPMKMHRRRVSKWYRLLICPSGCKDFEGHRQTALIDRGKINYKCEKFEACCIESMGAMKCGGCEK